MYSHRSMKGVTSFHSYLKNSIRLSSSKAPVLGIRREDSSLWERRCPLSPAHVKQLVRDGVKVLVAPSNRRAYPIQDYVAAGAIVKEDLHNANLIIGIKQPMEVDEIMPKKTYCFFSHTIKAQEASMPLLDSVLEREVRLMDYECMIDDKGKRLVAFGKYAGVAGMINILHGLGLRLIALGHHTPFTYIGPPHNYRNSGMACQAVRDAGYEIALGTMPKSIGPITFVFTGSGNVSQGAQEVFQQLPHEWVTPEHLPKVASHGDTSKIYGCVVDIEDHIVDKETGKLADRESYFRDPRKFASVFATKIAPYASLIVNGIYWAPGHPRLITIPDAKNLLQPHNMPWLPSNKGCPHLPHRLLAISDISADPGGSMEFVQECTSINHPFVLYDAEQHAEKESFTGSGVLVCSIDNMPTQLPREATDFFGSLLMPHIHEMLKTDATEPFESFQCSRTVKDSVIASNGSLTPRFKYIQELRDSRRETAFEAAAISQAKKKVLILGAGYVSAPVVEYLSRDPTNAVSVVSKFREEIQDLTSVFSTVNPVVCDAERHPEKLEELVSQHHLTISLLPYTLHPTIAEFCIKHRRNMVTASYLSPAMRDLNESALNAGVTVMNEVGVDPGIDHLLAMEIINDAHEHGGTIDSFTCICGGLPAPEVATNPLKYKFSWSPLGMIMAMMNPAKYLANGKVVEIEGNGEILNNLIPFEKTSGFNLEALANRDSTAYAQEYGILKAKTIVRGTFRYKGFSEVMKVIVKLGLCSTEPHPLLHHKGPDITWKELICHQIQQKPDILSETLSQKVASILNLTEEAVNDVASLGLFDGEDPLDKKDSPAATLSNYLSKKLRFRKNERDLIVMHHDIGITWADRTHERRRVAFTVYGDQDKFILDGKRKGFSAMAKTVGYPTAIAAQMILQGEIQESGMIRPFKPAIFKPLIKRLANEGLTAQTSSDFYNTYLKNL